MFHYSLVSPLLDKDNRQDGFHPSIRELQVSTRGKESILSGGESLYPKQAS